MKYVVVKADGVILSKEYCSDDVARQRAAYLRQMYKRMNRDSVYKVSVRKA